MDYIYPAEEEIPLKKIKIPSISKPILINKKLELDEGATNLNPSKIIYKKGAY